jgi:hypothetical protein
LCDQRIDKSDVLSADVPSSIGKHEFLNSTAATGTQAENEINFIFPIRSQGA